MAGTPDDRYDTRLDNKYGYSRTIDIPAEVAAHAPWFNQTLTQVNDSVVRLGILVQDDRADGRGGDGHADGRLSQGSWLPCSPR